MIDKKLLPLLIFGVIFLTSSAWGTDWYVRPYGAFYGKGDGTSYKNAWSGFSRIVWGKNGGVQTGHRLWVCGAHSEYSNVGASGSLGFPINIRLDYPTDPGSNNAAGAMAHALRISGVEYITVIGATFMGGTADAIAILNNSSNIKIGQTICRDTDVGILVLDAANCELYLNTVYNNTATGIKSARCDNLYVHFNMVHDNGNDGPNNHDNIFVGDGSQNVIVEHNIVYNQNSDFGTGIDCSGSADGDASAIVRYNLVNNCHSKEMAASGEFGNTDVFTFYGNSI